MLGKISSSLSYLARRHSRTVQLQPWSLFHDSADAGYVYIYWIPRLSSSMPQSQRCKEKTNMRLSSSTATSDNQSSALRLIEQVHNQRVPPGLVAQKVQETLLALVSDEKDVGAKHEEGPLALDLLKIAIQYDDNGESTLMPRICSLSMQVIKRSGHPISCNEIQRVMWMLLENRTKWFTQDLAVNTTHVNQAFRQVIQCHIDFDSKKIDHTARKGLDRLVNFMQQLWDDPSVPLILNSDAAHALVLYLCEQQKVHQAYDLLRRTTNNERLVSHPVVPLTLHPSSFTVVISTFGKVGEPEKSDEVIQWMLLSHRSNSSKDNIKIPPPPSHQCMNALMDCWARSSRKDSGKKAEAVLVWMQQLHDGPDRLDTKPDEISYAICTNAWAHSAAGRHSAMRAEAILRRMLDLHDAGLLSLGQTALPAFTSVMNAWARSRTDDAPYRVMELLKLSQDVHMARNHSNSSTDFPYTILIKAWKNFAASQRPGSKAKRMCGQNILQVLSDMEVAGVEPTTATRNAVIMALIEVSPIDAMLYFLEVEMQYQSRMLRLDTRTFNCGLNAIAICNKPDAAEQSLMVLQRMVEYAKRDDDVQPDRYTFNISLKVLSRSQSKDSALKANQLLDEMGKMPNLKPSFISYVTCVIAWGRSEDPTRFDRAQDLLEKFVDAHRRGQLAGQLSVVPFNAALAVCSHNTREDLQGKALKAAMEIMSTLRRLQPLIHPNDITYLSLFRALEVNYRYDDNDQLHRRLAPELERCAKDGLITAETLKAIYHLSPTTFRWFCGNQGLPETVKIPREWKRHVASKRVEPNDASRVELLQLE